MTRTRLPRLLDGELKELDRLHALRLSLTQNLAPLSTASMELPPGQAVKLRQLVELFTPHGSAGVFRITSVQSASGGVSKVTLSHGLCTLSDLMLSGSGESTGTARDILTAILATQTTWALGNCETDETLLTWRWDNSNALEALTDLMAELPRHYLAFDQSVLPWKLHVLKLTDADACECKLNRSMTGITIKEDDSQLCTRLNIPNVDAPMDADTIGTWGVISRVLEADPDLPQDMLLRAAQAYLEENKNPKLTISIDAVELARRTGDPFDRFICGKMCRTSLDDGAPIRQRIVRLQYTDLIGSPDVCKITLAAAADTASTAIAGLVVDTTVLLNKVSGNKKQLRLQAEEIDLLAREIALKASQTTVDGLGAQLSQVTLDLDAAETALIAKAEKAELQDVNTRLSSAELYLFGAEGKAGLVTQVHENSELIGQARLDLDAATSSVTLLGGKVDEQGNLLDGALLTLNGHESRIDANANAIALKADQASLDLANGRIEAQANEINLKADKIELEGLVKAAELQVVRANIDNLTSGVTTASTLKAHILNADTTLIVGGEIVGKRQISMGSIMTAGKVLSTDALDLQHSHEVTVDSSGKLQLGGVTAEGDGGNFNIADTQYYKNGVSAAAAAVGFASFAASGGVITPRLTNSKTTTYYCSSGSADENHKIPITIAADQYGNAAKTLMTVDASGVYKSGWNECRAAMSRISNVYTISQTAPGTLYMLVNGNYTSVGSDWVKVSSYGSAYSRPAEI